MNPQVSLSLSIASHGEAFRDNPAAEIARQLRNLAASVERGNEGLFSLRDSTAAPCGSAFLSIWEE